MASCLMCDMERINKEAYAILQPLGKGSYGEVVKAFSNKIGRVVALKMVKKERTNREHFLNELYVSTYLTGHEGFISTYCGFLETLDHYVITQELAPAGSLHSIIQPGVGISETLVKRCALQITQALEYMHGKNLVHRDLKPDNVLLMNDRCRNVKLSDFGLTQLAGSVAQSLSPIIPYMSPELCELKSNEYIVVDPSVDVWALGVLLYVTLTGSYPWRKALVEDPLYKNFVYWQSNMDHVSQPKEWKKISRKAQHMFHVIFFQDPSCRKDVEVVLDYLEFPWIVRDDTE